MSTDRHTTTRTQRHSVLPEAHLGDAIMSRGASGHTQRYPSGPNPPSATTRRRDLSLPGHASCPPRQLWVQALGKEAALGSGWTQWGPEPPSSPHLSPPSSLCFPLLQLSVVCMPSPFQLHSCWHRVLENSPGDRELVLPHSQQCLVRSLRGQERAGWELHLPGVLPRADSQRPLLRDADARVQGARCSESEEDSWHPPPSSLPPSLPHPFLPSVPPSFLLHASHGHRMLVKEPASRDPRRTLP